MKIQNFKEYSKGLDQVSGPLLENSLQREMQIRSIGLSTVDFDVKYDWEMEQMEEADFAFANAWNEGHLYIKSVNGEMETYVSNLEITISDGTSVWIDCYYTAFPRPGRQSNEHAKISIKAPNGKDNEINLRPDQTGAYASTGQKDLWMEELESQGSAVKAAIALWKKYR